MTDIHFFVRYQILYSSPIRFTLFYQLDLLVPDIQHKPFLITTYINFLEVIGTFCYHRLICIFVYSCFFLGLLSLEHMSLKLRPIRVCLLITCHFTEYMLDVRIDISFMHSHNSFPVCMRDIFPNTDYVLFEYIFYVCFLNIKMRLLHCSLQNTCGFMRDLYKK